jgi:hypothetical protein
MPSSSGASNKYQTKYDIALFILHSTQKCVGVINASEICKATLLVLLEIDNKKYENVTFIPCLSAINE